MRGFSRALAIAFVAAPATLFGHSLTYALGAIPLADGRHTYFLPALQALVTLALGLALALILRSLLLARRVPPKSSHVTLLVSDGGFLSLWASFSFAQCALFVSLEFLEGYRAGP